MRLEKTLKIVANHLVIDDGKGTFNLKEHPSSDRSWTYTAQDFSEGETQLTTFAIRFANADSTCRSQRAPVPIYHPADCTCSGVCLGSDTRLPETCCRRRQHFQGEIRGVPGGAERGR
jgi:hypothetical protein